MPRHISQEEVDELRAADMAAVEQQAEEDRDKAEARTIAQATHDRIDADVAALNLALTALQSSLTGKASASQMSAVVAAAATLSDRVTVLEAKRPASGTAAVATGLLGGGTRDITVTLSRSITGSYEAFPVLDAPAGVLGTLTATVKSTAAGSVVVTVKNTALVTLGTAATVRVLAVPT